MLPILLVLLSPFAFIEGSLADQILLPIALFATLWSFRRGKEASELVFSAVRRSGGLAKCFVLTKRGYFRSPANLRLFAEAATFCHIIVVPPWFFPKSGFSFYGLYAIGLASGVVRLMNDHMGRDFNIEPDEPRDVRP